MPIEKELWVDIIKEQPIQEGDFLNESEDLSALVDNNTLHLAEAWGFQVRMAEWVENERVRRYTPTA